MTNSSLDASESPSSGQRRQDMHQEEEEEYPHQEELNHFVSSSAGGGKDSDSADEDFNHNVDDAPPEDSDEDHSEEDHNFHSFHQNNNSSTTAESLLASHDASLASHRKKLMEHKKWLQQQRITMPNIKDDTTQDAAPNYDDNEAYYQHNDPYYEQSSLPLQSTEHFSPHDRNEEDLYTYSSSNNNNKNRAFLTPQQPSRAAHSSHFDVSPNQPPASASRLDRRSFSQHNSRRSSSGSNSTGRDRGEPIESVLLRKGRQRDEYKQQLQENQRLYEQSIHTFKPKISRDPENYHLSPGDRIEDRLFELEKEREGRLEQQREQVLQQYKFKPQVSENSRKIIPERPDILEVEQQWSAMRDEKLSHARDQRSQEELQHLREAPQLSDRTMKLLRSINYRFPHQSIPDYHAAKELERAEKIHSLQQEHLKKTMREKPNISPLSKKLVKKLEREGSVSDRLYQESFTRNMEREKRYRDAALGADEDSNLAEGDRRYTFRPDSSSLAYYAANGDSESTTSSTARARDIYTDLVRKGKDIELKRQLQMEFLAAKEKQLHNKTKINPVSAEIASRLPTSSKERLYNSHKKKKTPQYSEEFTFKPKINARSREMIQEFDYQSASARSPRRSNGSPRASTGSSSRIDRLYSMDQRKRERIQSLQEHYEQLEISECTFKPDLKKTKKYMKSNYGFASPRGNRGSMSHSGQLSDDDMTSFQTEDSTVDGESVMTNNSQFYGLSFQERAEQWSRKREKKRKEAEKMARNSELRECTFSPKTISKESPVTSLITSPRTSLGSPRAVLQDDGNPLGYGQFVNRQREARRRKQELQEQKKSPRNKSNSWKNRITQPQPFKLGKERTNHTPVRSLQKALSPPSFKKHVQKTQGANAKDYLLNDDDEDRQKPSPLKTDSVPRQGLFSTRSSVQILDSLHMNYDTSPLGKKPSLLEDSVEYNDEDSV